MFLVLLGLVVKTFGFIKDIHFYLLVVVALPWISPIGATNWHISLVWLKPPTRHTCYTYVAKKGISAPLPHIVWTQHRVPLSTCVSIPLFLHAECNTHLQITNVHAHLLAHKETHSNMSLDTCKYGRPLKKEKKNDRCWCVVTWEGRQINTQLTHTHVYAFTITLITVGRLCTVVLGT